MEIETIQKAQTEGNLKIENLGKQTGTTDMSITNRIQETKERISAIVDVIEETDTLVKESIKAGFQQKQQKAYILIETEKCST